MSQRKLLPIGIDDFKKLRQGHFRFVDKSLLIEEILNLGFEVLLLLRPRRFGKTLQLSMLKYFFSLNEQNVQLFDDLAIKSSQSQCLNEQQQYPVIFLSLKNIKAQSWEAVIDKFKQMASDLYKEFDYLLQSDELYDSDKKRFQAIIDQNTSMTQLESSLKNLSNYLSAHHKKKVIILIDEYDTPIHEAHHFGYTKTMLDFMRSLLGEALKGNLSLRFGIVTGILRIAKESLFSGINNLKVYSALDNRFSAYFGWTEQEVKEILKEYQLEVSFKEVEKWYNGYCVGERGKIYNPWSVINYVSDPKSGLRPYWINTGNPRLLLNLLAKSSDSIKIEFESLLESHTISQKITENLTMNSIDKSDTALWTLLLYSGYLTPISTSNSTTSQTILKIPNNEVKVALEEFVQSWFLESANQSFLKSILTELTQGNIHNFSRMLTDYIEQVLSYFDIKGNEPERFYHALVLGMLVELRGKYHIRSNRESGYGRYDVMLIPKDTTQLGIIVEFKKANRQESLDASVQEALLQIKEKAYDKELRAAGVQKISAVAIAFLRKEVRIAEKNIS